MFLLVLLAYLVIALVQIPKLVENRYWKDLVIFCLFFGFALIFSLLYSFGIKMTSPPKVIQSVLDAIHLHY